VYEVSIDYSKMQKAVEIEKKALEREMRVLERLDRPDLDVETLKSTLGLVKEDTVYVSNLPFSCTEKDLRELFGDCGQIMSVRLPENRQTKQNRGFAFITLDSEKAARKALNYDGHKFYDRKLRVSKAEKRIDLEDSRPVREKDPSPRLQRKHYENEEELKRGDRDDGRRGRDSYRSGDRETSRRDRRKNRSRSRESRSRSRDRKYRDERDRRERPKQRSISPVS